MAGVCKNRFTPVKRSGKLEQQIVLLEKLIEDRP
jgi:hypothetical protein